MGFYDVLQQNNLTDLLGRVDYPQPKFVNSDKVTEKLKDIVLNNRKTFIIGDYDVDGAMCNRINGQTLHLAGNTNYQFYQYRQRMHSLDPVAVQQCIQGKFEYCIIGDCGSNNTSLLRRLLSYGVKVILLDHHETMTTYEEFEELGDISVINTTLEPVEYKLSAGALCYCVMSRFLQELNINELGLSVYALISLYADCMDMRDSLNRAIYYRAVGVQKVDIPSDVAMFMNQYQIISARFINFWFSPRINAMFRSENLDVLNKLFLMDEITTSELSGALQEINDKYQNIRDMITKVADIIEVTELETFVIADLYSVNKHVNVVENKLWNYTGLVANKLSERYSKAAFVYCDNNNAAIKGSIRDIFGRDFLSPFSQLCKAEGHNPAFGLNVHPLDLENLLDSIKRLDKKIAFSPVSNKPIVLNYTFNQPDTSLIEDIAVINEFTGPNVPVVLLRKQKVGAMPERKTDYGYKYTWGDYQIQSAHAVSFGGWMMLKPTKGLKTKLILQ